MSIRAAPAPARERVLPALSGLLLALSFPPLAPPLLPFIALVPLLLHIEAGPRGPGSIGRATRGGLTSGLVYFGLQLYWIAVALFDRSALAIPAYLLMVAVLATLIGGFAAAVRLARERLAVPLPIAAALFWTTAEWLRAHLGDLAFPWLGLGAALAPLPVLAGAADLVGVRGLSLWIAAVNGLLAAAVLRYRAGRPVPSLLAGAALLVLAPIGYGVWRARNLELRSVGRVAVVGPAIEDDLRREEPEAALDTAIDRLRSLTLRLDDGEVDLVVWPEAALPVDLDASERLLATVADLAGTVGAPIVVGAYAADDRGRFNAAFLVGSGPETTRYDKRRLVPFVEAVPFLDRPSTFARGAAAPLFRTAGGDAFGVLICYESIFAGLSRGYRARGADFIVNITNDAWFGGDGWLERTTGVWQHPAHLVLRAIETRTGVARAANGGFSMFVDPLGRDYGRVDPFEPGVRVAPVYTTSGTTLFVRWGDWAATAAALAALLVLVAAAVTLEDHTCLDDIRRRGGFGLLA